MILHNGAVVTDEEMAARHARMAKYLGKYPVMVKKGQYPAPIPWSDAGMYRAQGFHTMPVERTQLERGAEGPSGAYAHGLIGEPCNPRDVTVGILGCRLFIGNASLDECKSTWVGFVRIEVSSDKGLARVLGDVVTRYLPGGPVRVDAATPSMLLPFQLAAADVNLGNDPREWTRSTNPYADNTVRVCTAGESFIPNGHRYSWVDGYDLLACHRASLPTLSIEQSRNLVMECEALIKARASTPPTRLERLMARAMGKG